MYCTGRRLHFLSTRFFSFLLNAVNSVEVRTYVDIYIYASWIMSVLALRVETVIF